MFKSGKILQSLLRASQIKSTWLHCCYNLNMRLKGSISWPLQEECKDDCLLWKSQDLIYKDGTVTSFGGKNHRKHRTLGDWEGVRIVRNAKSPWKKYFGQSRYHSEALFLRPRTLLGLNSGVTIAGLRKDSLEHSLGNINISIFLFLTSTLLVTNTKVIMMITTTTSIIMINMINRLDCWQLMENRRSIQVCFEVSRLQEGRLGNYFDYYADGDESDHNYDY